MNNEDLRKLKAAALAATQGTWDRSNRPIGPFYHISSDHGIDGICSQGHQSIGTMNATDKKAAPQYAVMFQANADFVITFQPKVVLALIAEVEQARIANGWISVSVQLPEKYTEVLVWPAPTDYCQTAERDDKGFYYGEYLQNYGHTNERLSDHHVTH